MTRLYETTLWQSLSEKGFVEGDEPAQTDDSAPWYVRTMLGIAGWIGAIFMLAAVFSGFAIMFDSAILAGVLGILACSLAVFIYRWVKGNDFMLQFGFAISLAGQGLLVFSMLETLQVFEAHDNFLEGMRLLALTLVVIQTVLFIAIPNFLHRVWSGVIGVGAMTFLMIQFGIYPFTIVILLAATAIIWLQEFNWVKYTSMIQALGYSLVFVCFAHLVTDNQVLGLSSYWQKTFGVQPLGGPFGKDIAASLLGVVLISVVLVLLRQSAVKWLSGKGIAALLLAILVAVVGTQTPGITIGLVLVVLGYAHGNKVLSGIGLVTLLVFLSQFYYELELTLLHKSFVLFFSGVALLLVRQLLQYFWPKLELSNA